jgi:hypothetical protein
VDGRAGFPRWKLAGVYESDLCPRQTITDDSRRWLSLYPHYDKGHLFARGGLSDQPALYLDVMSLIAQTVSQARQETNG